MGKNKIGFIGFRSIPHSYGGGEAFIRELAPRLALKDDIEIIVYCRYTSEPRDICTYVYKGVKKVFLPTIKHKIFETFIHSLLSTLYSIFINKIDIIDFHTLPSAPFCIFSKIFNIKSVINVDGIDWERDKWGKLGKLYLKFAAFIAVKFGNVLISDATEIKRIYLEKFKRDSIMIAYGANIGYSKNPEIIKQYGVSSEKYYFIACRFVPENNIDLLIKAYNKLNTNKFLIIAGDANYKSNYFKYCKTIASEKVIFTGHISNHNIIKELHCNTYAYLHGHSLGGTNPSLLKALGYGNCVVALNTPYNSEVLSDGKYGILFNNVEDCYEKLTKIENNYFLRNKYTRIARNRIKEKYTWRKITEQYYSIFKNIYKKL